MRDRDLTAENVTAEGVITVARDEGRDKDITRTNRGRDGVRDEGRDSVTRDGSDVKLWVATASHQLQLHGSTTALRIQ